MSDAFLYLGGLVLAAYFFRLWYEDYRHNTQRIHHNLAAGNPVSSEIIQTGLPGSTPASWRVIAIAVVGSLGILALEVAGEYRLDVVEDQTTMSVLLGIYTLAAAFVEELIFRGFLFFDRHGKWRLYLSVFGISILFAVIHPYLWSYDVPENQPPWLFWKWIGLNIYRDDGTLNVQPIFSTCILFMNSVWFYYVRLSRLNRFSSLIPCVAAHLASNLGVFAVKAWQGKVVLFD
tara:strand:+ start:562 stop:1260 length:699 start_codon:yes stop_codon:yes gene_type:complete